MRACRTGRGFQGFTLKVNTSDSERNQITWCCIVPAIAAAISPFFQEFLRLHFSKNWNTRFNAVWKELALSQEKTMLIKLGVKDSSYIYSDVVDFWRACMRIAGHWCSVPQATGP